jgi:carboxyl-terminal processing protease
MKKLFLIALSIIISLSACNKMFLEPSPSQNAKAVFDQVYQDFRDYYALFEERNVNWTAIYNEFSPQINTNSSDEQLYQVLTQMLARLDDGHVGLTAPGREVFYANRFYREKLDYELFKPSVIKEKYLKNQFMESDGDEDYLYGLLPNNIIYIHFPNVGSNWQKLNEVIKQYPNNQGLIIDLRHNEGGDFTYAFAEIAQLNSQTKPVFRSRTKNGQGANDFTDWHTWQLEGKGNYTKKIKVLTDRFTISAGERAVMGLKVMNNVQLIGDLTNGSVSTMMSRELPNGWYIRLATQEVLNPEGNTYEGIGIPPHISVKNTLAELNQGKDAVLERAIQEFN